MDLSTVRDKLQNEEYLLPKDFIQDVHLIFNNAKLYNQTRSQVKTGINCFSIPVFITCSIYQCFSFVVENTTKQLFSCF